MADFNDIERDLNADTLHRAFMASLEVMTMKGKKLMEEYRSDVAHSLLSAGIALIPSDHLLDHQFVVSRGVYEAAKQLVDAKGPA